MGESGDLKSNPHNLIECPRGDLLIVIENASITGSCSLLLKFRRGYWDIKTFLLSLSRYNIHFDFVSLHLIYGSIRLNLSLNVMRIITNQLNDSDKYRLTTNVGRLHITPTPTLTDSQTYPTIFFLHILSHMSTKIDSN